MNQSKQRGWCHSLILCNGWLVILNAMQASFILKVQKKKPVFKHYSKQMRWQKSSPLSGHIPPHSKHKNSILYDLHFLWITSLLVEKTNNDCGAGPFLEHQFVWIAFPSQGQTFLAVTNWMGGCQHLQPATWELMIICIYNPNIQHGFNGNTTGVWWEHNRGTSKTDFTQKILVPEAMLEDSDAYFEVFA